MSGGASDIKTNTWLVSTEYNLYRTQSKKNYLNSILLEIICSFLTNDLGVISSYGKSHNSLTSCMSTLMGPVMNAVLLPLFTIPLHLIYCHHNAHYCAEWRTLKQDAAALLTAMRHQIRGKITPKHKWRRDLNCKNWLQWIKSRNSPVREEDSKQRGLERQQRHVF